MTSTDYPLELAERGWYVFPCSHSKTPIIKSAHPDSDPLRDKCHGECGDDGHGFYDATIDPAKIRSWWSKYPDALVGVYCERSGIIAIDLDQKNGTKGIQSWNELIKSQGEIEAGPIQQTPSGGRHYFFRFPEGVKIPNSDVKLAPGVELLSNGCICTGKGYTWWEQHGLETPLTDAPAWLLELISKLGEKKAPQARTRLPAEISSPSSEKTGAYWLEKYLSQAAPGNRNDNGFQLASQLRDSRIPLAEAESIMLEYAVKAPGDGYTEREALASLREAYKAPPRESAHLPGIAYLGTSNGNGNENHKAPDLSKAPESGSDSGDLPTTTPTPGSYKLDDIGNGERLAARYGYKLRYVKEWGWMCWTGKVWTQDRGQVARMAKRTARSIFAEAAIADDDERAKAIAKHASASASQARRAAMIDACSSEPGISATPQEFDNNPWLLNCENGILNLQTGELLPYNPQALVTKIAGTRFDPEAPCPLWSAFLGKIFSNDREMIAFIQRAVGYSLTGNVGEQCLFDLFGIGKNGKSVFTGTLQAVMGDYGQKTPSDTLMLKYYDNGINNDLARLAGAGVVIAAELAEGKRLNESMVKDLTGGDIIAARYLHKEFFEFRPNFKLWMYGNHLPIIGGTDEGIWRRIKKIDFKVVISEAERDPNLLEKLKGELPGILAWAVQGCLAWRLEGLKTPASVDSATDAYRAEQDTLGAFLRECCIIQSGTQVTAGELFDAYDKWGGDLYKRRFSQAMAERGFVTRGRDHAGRWIYHGIGLLEPRSKENG